MYFCTAKLPGLTEKGDDLTERNPVQGILALASLACHLFFPYPGFGMAIWTIGFFGPGQIAPCLLFDETKGPSFQFIFENQCC